LSKSKSHSSTSKKAAKKSSAAKRTSSPQPTTAATLDPMAPGPRMQQVLQAEIAPWKRENFNDEEAQLKEIKRIPVRNVYDAEEARRRLLGRATQSGKRRFSRSKGAAPSRS
jgi:hypothetical protein